MYVKHFLALVCFFFLFTLLDPSNRAGIGQVWFKTLMVYGLFVMSTRSKAWASILVVILLIIDQTIKMQINYLNSQPTPDETQIQTLGRWRTILYQAMIAVIVLGFIHYYVYQRSEYGKDFELLKYLFGVQKCRDV
jgi:lysylphosphatidylglycerol synthetase-like protein (DUF2156 family)